MGELSPYGLDVFSFCTFDCAYCTAASDNHFVGNKKNFDKEKLYNLYSIHELNSELQDFDKQILVSPYCDPYSGTGKRLTRTRLTLKALHNNGIPTVVLTKSGCTALKDADVFRSFGDRLKFGTTLLTCDEKLSKEIEGNSASVIDRIATLGELHQQGIKTFVALIPVLSAEDALDVVERTLEYSDEYFIGLDSTTQETRSTGAYREQKEADLEAIVSRLRRAGKKFYVSESYQALCSNVFLTRNETEKTDHWMFKDRAIET